VIGGGPAGLAAATTCAKLGLRVLLADDQLRPGGSLRTDPRTGRAEAEARLTAATAAGVEVLARSTAISDFFPKTTAVCSRSRHRIAVSRARARVDLGDRRISGEPSVLGK